MGGESMTVVFRLSSQLGSQVRFSYPRLTGRVSSFSQTDVLIVVCPTQGPCCMDPAACRP